MEYRDITTDDVQSVTGLVRRVFLEFVAPGYSQEGIDTFEAYIRPENLKNALQNGTLFMAGCYEEGRLVGVVAVRNYDHISLLFVDKAYHGRKIAKTLLKRAVKRCVFRNPGLTEITVHSSPCAVDAYRRLGFETAGDQTTRDGITFVPMRMAFEIRPAKNSELTEALGLLKEASQWLKSKKIEYWQDWQNPPSSFIEWVKKGLSLSQFHFFYINGKLSGMFRLQYEDALFWGYRQDRAGYLHSFTVKRSLHGMGLGHWLIERIKSILSNNGIYTLRLDCDADIEGLRMYYENEGFVEVGETELFSERYTLYEARWNRAEAYKRFAGYYDAYVAGFREDIPLYLHFANGGMDVLEVGCGTGRILKPLLDAGCRVTGVDISAGMLAIAKRNLADYMETGRLTLLEHDLCMHNLDKRFSRAFVTFYTFNYFIEDENRETFLTNVYACLDPGGIIVLDLFYPATFSDPALEDQWRKRDIVMNGRKIRLEDKRSMTGAVEQRIQRYINGDAADEIVTRRRYFKKPDIQKMLLTAGFHSIRFADGYAFSDLHPLHGQEEATGSFIVVAQK